MRMTPDKHMINLRAAILGMLLVFLALAPARAETTDWAVSEGGRMRLVALAPDAGNKVRAALEIETKPGWITYWREPGASGIPPQITVGGGPELSRLRFPVPKILALGDLQDIGYDGPVALPFELENAGKPARLDVFIGVCNEICIPFQASFQLTLAHGLEDADATMIVTRAEAAIAGNQREDFQVTALTPTKKAITLGLRLPVDKGEVEVIATGPPGYVYTAKQAISARDQQVTLPVSDYPAGSNPDDETWRFVVKAGGQAMETEIDSGD